MISDKYYGVMTADLSFDEFSAVIRRVPGGKWMRVLRQTITVHP
jgi:hypothetical protein